MSTDSLIAIAQEGLWLLCVLVAPPVGAALAAGLLVAIVQTATQIQEQTVGFAVRFAAVVVALFVAGPMIASRLESFTQSVFAAIAQVGGS